MRKRIHHKWTIEPKHNLHENARSIIPLMYDQFMSQAETVIRHPRLTGELHRMRVEGKPLRYLMELFEDRLGKPFRHCFAEIKNMIELMGKIHDCDIVIPMLQNHLQEMRFFNKALSNRKESIPTRGIRELIRRQRTQRTSMFQEMCTKLRTWQVKNFREQLVNSMLLSDHPINNNHLIKPTTYGNLYLATCASS